MEFNDRRKLVEAAARSGAIKAMPKKETKKVFRVNKPLTRLTAGTAMVGREVSVTPGSKKEARLQKRQDWAKQYGEDQSTKFNAKMAKEKTRRESGK
jgi:hypothetical protein